MYALFLVEDLRFFEEQGRRDSYLACRLYRVEREAGDRPSPTAIQSPETKDFFLSILTLYIGISSYVCEGAYDKLLRFRVLEG